MFGWTGGKQLVSSSYTDAKEQVAEQKEARRKRKEDKKAEKEAGQATDSRTASGYSVGFSATKSPSTARFTWVSTGRSGPDGSGRAHAAASSAPSRSAEE